MGSIYLTWLADDLAAAGLQVVRYQGWTTRARASGGYDAQPLCVMWHHTASQTTPDNDCYYMCFGSPDHPICNLYVARDGAVWVLAAGATNTNGKGRSMTFSRGTVGTDNMNRHAVSIEIANNGVGENYPQAQIDAAFKVSNTVNRHLGNQPSDVATHQSYAPDRKIDPARASALQGPWRPREINSSGSWHVDDLRDECRRRAGTTPSDEEGYVRLFDGLWKRDNDDAVFAVYTDGTKKWVPDPGMLNALAALEMINGAPPDMTTVRVQADPCMFSAFGLVVGPRPPGTDEWGNKV